MFNLVSGVTPVGNTVATTATSAAAAAAPIGGSMLNPVRLLDPLRPKKCVEAVKLPPKQSERIAVLMKYVGERWWAIRPEQQQQQPAAAGSVDQLDVILTLKALIAAHFPNADVRRNLYRAILSKRNIDAMMAAEEDTEQRELAEFAAYTRAADAQQPMVPVNIWVALFEEFRLPPCIINQSAGRLSFKEDYMTADPNTHSKPLPDTTAFVYFLQTLIAKMNCGFDASHTILNNLYHDSVLLYFATLCLMKKNAVELLWHPHFDYLEAPLGRSRVGLTADGKKRQQTFRDAVYSYMHEIEQDVRLDAPEAHKDDWLERIRPVERSWVVILRKLCAKKIPQTIVAPAEAAAPEEPAAAEPATEEPAAEEPTTPAAAAGVTPGAETTAPGPEQEEAPGAATATPTAAGAAATTTEPAAASIAARMGPVRTRNAAQTNALFAHPLLSVASAQAGAARAASALICAGINKQQPSVAQSLCGGTVLSSLPRNTSDWYSTLKLLDGAVARRGANLEGVDKLARYAGWANAPVDERAKRYVAAYCGADIDELWSANGWKPLSDVERARINRYKSVNPQPSAQTTQVLMHLAGTDE